MIGTPMRREIPPRLTLTDDRTCPDSVSAVAGRADLGSDLKPKRLGENAATV